MAKQAGKIDEDVSTNECYCSVISVCASVCLWRACECDSLSNMQTTLDDMDMDKEMMALVSDEITKFRQSYQVCLLSMGHGCYLACCLACCAMCRFVYNLISVVIVARSDSKNACPPRMSRYKAISC